VIDDEEMNIEFIKRILSPESGCELASTTDPRDAAALYREFRPDLVLLDIKMPYLDGFRLLELFRAETPRSFVPVVVLTSDVGPETKRQALAAGAKDFLTKPFSPVEVRLRVRNLLETRALHLELEEQNQHLETRVRERTHELVRRTLELDEARVEILERLARAAEYRDDETGLHTQRVGRMAALVAAALELPEDQVELIARAAPLHDVGKIGVPDAVLLKDGRLTAAEFQLMQSHTVIGAGILSGSRVRLLAVGRDIALTHHEHWNGGGYPHGLRGEDIPIAGRAVAVADVFDALTHDRPYKPRWQLDEALAEMQRLSGNQFDPRVLDLFMWLCRDGLIGVDGPTRPQSTTSTP
jgi:putative two-component system response regulator